MTRVYVVMGVAGSGKTTIGKGLARALQASFEDADDLHPAANVEKMARGVPLTDEDRWPWLDQVGRAAHRDADSRGRAVMACSALRRVYRERLVAAAGEPIAFVHVTGERDLIAARMAARKDHFMPPSLLDSQFATLEPPASDEFAVTVANDRDPDHVVLTALDKLRGLEPGGATNS